VEPQVGSDTGISEWGNPASQRLAPQGAVLALVINELVDNALTHGLGIEGGRIEVEAVLKHGQVVVEVRDDGPRHPAPPPRQSSGLGLQIIETLVKGDLNGSFSLTRDVEAGWTRARICFPQRIIDEERIEG